MKTIDRTLVATFPAAVPGKVIVAAYVQIDGRWYGEPRAIAAADYKGPPSREDLARDILDAAELNCFGSSIFWPRVAGPSLTPPKFLFS